MSARFEDAAARVDDAAADLPPASQPELSLLEGLPLAGSPPTGSRRAGLVGWAGEQLHRLPLIASALLLLQIAALGLVPGLIESRRLAREEGRLAERGRQATADRDVLELRLAALSDPIYIERERRLARLRRSPEGLSAEAGSLGGHTPESSSLGGRSLGGFAPAGIAGR